MNSSQASQDYLKAIYALTGRGERATTSAIAASMGVTPASTTSMLKQLALLELVVYTPYHGVELTSAGEREALEVLRHHRLLELYLVKVLGMDWQMVHAEADRLEHVISEEFEVCIDAALGRPLIDPHGDPIPTPEGTIDQTRYLALADACPGSHLVVRRVIDVDAGILLHLGNLGLVPNAVVDILAIAPFQGPLTIRVGDATHAIGRDLARMIHVSSA